jgi:large subunit ribosomal protein L23
MAIFGTKDKTVKKAPAKKSEGASRARGKKDGVRAAQGGAQQAVNSGAVLLRPRITEKAAHLSAQNVYTFEVARNATKTDVINAIHAVYKVTPLKVNVVNNQGKRVRLRTRRGFGTRSGVKKVYVHLKKGDRIEFAS